MLTCGDEFVAAPSGPYQAIALQLIESVVIRLLWTTGDANEVPWAGEATGGDLPVEGDQQLFPTILEEMLITHLEFTTLKGVTEAAVIRTTKFQAMPDTDALSVGVVFDLDEMNDAWHFLKSRLAPDALHRCTALALVCCEIQTLQ